jgi:DNA mismatch endonuclease, patch repair protein
MARVRQRNTAAEGAVAKVLRDIGVAYRLNARSLPGSPDFANRRRRWAIFVHGCFWHQHTGCPKATVPKRNRDFWLEKFTTNRQRDARSVKQLRQMGFRVFVIWECQSKDPTSLMRRLLELQATDT